MSIRNAQPGLGDHESPADPIQAGDWVVPEPQDIAAELQKEFGDDQQYEAQGKLDGILQATNNSSMERRKSELDTLLVYAGLFSAVLTAFNVESYRLLQPDSTESMAAALWQVSEQLNNLAVHQENHTPSCQSWTVLRRTPRINRT